MYVLHTIVENGSYKPIYPLLKTNEIKIWPLVRGTAMSKYGCRIAPQRELNENDVMSSIASYLSLRGTDNIWAPTSMFCPQRS